MGIENEFTNRGNEFHDEWLDTVKLGDKIEPGTILYTKDGRRTGNALVLSIEHDPKYNHTMHLCMSDFGNMFVFREDEIRQYFHIGPVTSIDQSFQDRAARIIAVYKEHVDDSKAFNEALGRNSLNINPAVVFQGQEDAPWVSDIYPPKIEP